MAVKGILATYSGKNLVGSLNHPLAPAGIQFSGIAEAGIQSIRVTKTETQTVLEVGADGSVQPSAVPGDQGEIEVVVFQTSEIHRQFLDLSNKILIARDSGDLVPWLQATIYIQNTITGQNHYATGCGISKQPDVSYGKQATTITWVWMAANIGNQ